MPSSLFWRLFNMELWLRNIFCESGLEMKHRPDANRILFTGGI
jgi:hypothetical protein